MESKLFINSDFIAESKQELARAGGHQQNILARVLTCKPIAKHSLFPFKIF